MSWALHEIPWGQSPREAGPGHPFLAGICPKNRKTSAVASEHCGRSRVWHGLRICLLPCGNGKEQADMATSNYAHGAAFTHEGQEHTAFHGKSSLSSRVE